MTNTEKPCFVYMLECRNGAYYVGITSDLEQRLLDHIEGRGACYTWRHRPLKLVRVEEFPSREQAARRERRLKGLSRSRKRELADRRRLAVTPMSGEA